jgi:hypothetical protein
MGQKEYFTPEDYQWLESFTGTTGNKRESVFLDEPDINTGIFYRYVVPSFNVKSFDLQMQFLYKFAHHQRMNEFIISSSQLVSLMDQIVRSESDMPGFARSYLEEQCLEYKRPIHRGEPISFDVIETIVSNANPELYRRLKNEVRTA